MVNRSYVKLITAATILFFSAALSQAQTYVNDSIGIKFDIPDHWVSEVQGQSVVFSGATGTAEWRTTLNIQYIEAGSTSLDDLVENLREQWRKEKGYRELSSRRLQIRGYEARNIEVEYLMAGTSELYRQNQLVVEKDDHFYLLGYTAPASMYSAHLNKMDTAVQSLKLSSSSSSAKTSVGQTSPSASDEIQIIANNLRVVIGSIQLFRELGATKGMAGWETFASDEVLQAIQEINTAIWEGIDPDDGWKYVFSLSSIMINKLESGDPVVGFYHPWSDTWIITEWVLKSDPVITSVELLTGDWLRKKGTPPFDFPPNWILKKTFPAESLARSFAENLALFEKIVYSPEGWRTTIQADTNQELLLDYNYPAYMANLLSAWTIAMDFHDLESKSPGLPELRIAVQEFLSAGAKGQLQEALDSSKGTTDTAKRQLTSIPPEDFEAFTTIYWMADSKYSAAFLSFAGNSEQLLSLFFVNGWSGVTLDRVDLIDLLKVRQVSR